jgi:hypothetical protein
MSRSDSFGTACASVEVIVTQTYFDRRSAPPPARSRASCSAPTRQRFLTTLGHAPGRYPCGVPKIASCLQIADFSGAHRVLVPHRALPTDSAQHSGVAALSAAVGGNGHLWGARIRTPRSEVLRLQAKSTLCTPQDKPRVLAVGLGWSRVPRWQSD